MNKKSNNFSALFLLAVTTILGFSLLYIGKKTSALGLVESRVENLLKEESLFVNSEFRRDFAAYLVATAKDHELDPFLILAIMKVESSFKPHAVSHRGALGLLQLKPVAAREVANVFNVAPVSSSQLMNPFVNVHIGVKYLSYLRDLLGNDKVLFLTAYNQGPTRVRRLKNYSSGYAKKVLSIYRQYLKEYLS